MERLCSVQSASIVKDPIRFVTAASFIEKLNEEMHSLFRLFLLLTRDADEAGAVLCRRLEGSPSWD